MEVLTEEESQAVLKSMFPAFISRPIDRYDIPSLNNAKQAALLVHGPGQKYRLQDNQIIPTPQSEREILVKVVAIGLNPVDWKGPEYNFGLPSLPWINGRDLAGIVIKAHGNLSRIRVGDVVLSPSTDYRDLRKAAFQEYVVTTEYNCARVPESFPVNQAAVLGVAFVAAALSLGISLGVNFSNVEGSVGGPDLLSLIRRPGRAALATDVQQECLSGIREEERAMPGDWIAIWGASSATGLVAFQLAKLAKLRTICVVDVARHGERLLNAGADLLVDRFDPERAITIIRSVTRGRLRFGLDTVGRETAEHLRKAMCTSADNGLRSHLVGLAGVPKNEVSGVVHHQTPIKVFHDVATVGESLMTWLERLLLTGRLHGPETEIAFGGLGGINEALDQLRAGPVFGKRLVVPLEYEDGLRTVQCQ